MAKAKGKKGKSSSEKPAATKAVRNVLGYRDGTMPPNMNFRTQNHGDEPVQASDIRLKEIELSKAETNVLLQDRYAERALWTSGGRGKPERPTLERINAMRLSETIESAKVWIKAGGEEIALGVCKLKNVDVEPKIGGIAHMACTVQSTPTIDGRVATLITQMKGKVRVKIEYEHNAEQLEAFDSEGDAKGDENAQFEKDAKAQVDAFKRGTPVGDSAPADTH